MTSNPLPPLHDGASMKRLAVRYFPDTETHLKDEQSSKEFSVLLSQLQRLHELGSFRNKFVMDNQELILDKKLTPFEKAKRIAVTAYECTQTVIPNWLMGKAVRAKPLTRID